jgi:hypothetical protein
MSYAITFPSQQALLVLLKSGGDETLLLSRPDNTIHAHVKLERIPARFELSIEMCGTKSSLALPGTDADEACRHTIEHLEAVANGTADTALAPSAKRSASICLADQRLLVETCRNGGHATLQLGALVTVHRQGSQRTAITCMHGDTSICSGSTADVVHSLSESLAALLAA